MRILALYGLNCRKEVWDGFKPYLQGHTVDYVEYPHEVTAEAKEVEDLTKWVFDTYKGNSYQAVIGHSLGGAIALQLATRYGMKFEHIIYLDTNLLPAGGFYRNLMTEEHMEQFGEKLMAIFQEERNYYTKELFDALQKEFDYSKEVMELNQKVYAIYGDRNQPEYSNRVEELMLPNDGCALMIYIAKNISIGTMEEFIVRGLFLSLFIHCWRKQRRCDCKAVMISSLIFSLAHLGNLLNNDINSVLAQIIYAFFLGVYFAVVTLRSNNIWPGILIHGMIDFVGDIGTLMNTNEDKAVSAVKTMRSFSFVKVIENTGVLMTLPLFVYAIILLIGIRKESRNEQ